MRHFKTFGAFVDLIRETDMSYKWKRQKSRSLCNIFGSDTLQSSQRMTPGAMFWMVGDFVCEWKNSCTIVERGRI